MANNFKRYTNKDVNTSLETVYTVPASKNSIIIGCLRCNKTGSGVTASVFIDAHEGATSDVYLVKDVQIPGGSSLEVVEGKIVVTHTGSAGDVVQAIASTASAVDITLSVLEDVA